MAQPCLRLSAALARVSGAGGKLEGIPRGFVVAEPQERGTSWRPGIPGRSHCMCKGLAGGLCLRH